MRKLMVPLVALSMLIGMIVVGLAIFDIGPLAKYKEQFLAAAPKAPPPHPVYMNMDTLNIPIIRADKVDRTIMLLLEIECMSNRCGAVANNLPRLRDAFIAELYDFLPRHLRAGRDTPDHKVIKKVLVAVASKMFGDGYVTDVLIRSSFQR